MKLSLFRTDSTTAPSGYLTVSDGQMSGAQGTIACQVDFDIPPILKNAYLKTSVGERVKITDVNLKATSQTLQSIIWFSKSVNPLMAILPIMMNGKIP